ncbi:MAG TPA: hypothetical protein VD790_09070 [Thermoleophilaceae bacterium]|nr:hypothetical protein [Thermoleophilaceae bacterium]
MSRSLAKTLTLACLATGALLALAPGAPAAPYMVSIMQDDNQLVYATGEERGRALNRMAALGVEAVRATVHWSAMAPKPNARRKPRGFDGADPRDYPDFLWDRFDNLTEQAARLGIAVYLNPTGGGPRWAHRKTRDRAYQRSYRPNVKEFAKFMVAVGRRYSGTYRDENNGREVLPSVRWWSLWNEPNQPGWLTPQGERKRGAGMVPMAPHLYRDLVVAGARSLLRTGHADDLVLFGELAPVGNEKPDGLRPSLRPGLFLREMYCLDRRFRPFEGEEALARGCEDVERLAILERFPRLGFAHHPYTKLKPPGRRERGRDALTMANLDALPRLLDRIAARTDLLPPEIPIYFTEYGYETKPPDPFSGVSLNQQAAYINAADYMAWKHPRVFANAQFQLFDVPPRTEFPRDSTQYWFTYQSGLFSSLPNPQPKPAMNAYRFPLVVRRTGSTARIWGQVRFAVNGTTYPLLLQQRNPGTSSWVRSGAALEVTHSQGYFQALRRIQPGTAFRAIWSEPDFSRFVISRVVVAR